MNTLTKDQIQKLTPEQQADVAALETAVRINPRIWQLQQHLAELYRQRGDAERAAWHQRRAVP